MGEVEATVRERDQVAGDVIFRGLVCSSLDEAENWGKAAYNDQLEDPFTPTAVGHDEVNFWPVEDGNTMSCGDLPENADLEYGVTVDADSAVLLGYVKCDGGYAALLTGNVSYAEKVEAEEPVADDAAAEVETATEAVPDTETSGE